MLDGRFLRKNTIKLPNYFGGFLGRHYVPKNQTALSRCCVCGILEIALAWDYGFVLEQILNPDTMDIDLKTFINLK